MDFTFEFYMENLTESFGLGPCSNQDILLINNFIMLKGIFVLFIEYPT